MNVDEMIKKQQDPDIELIAKIQGGSENAFYELVRRYQDPVCRIAYRIIGDLDEARDVAQDVFLVAHQTIPKWTSQAKFFTWLYRTTINIARGKKRKRNKMDYFTDQTQYQEPHHENTPADPLLAAERKHKLQRILNKLPDRQRQAVILRIYEGLNVQDTADVMKCRSGTVKALLYQAIQSLAKTWGKEVEPW